MEMIVVGCGRVGSELAYRLYKSGQKLAVIDPLLASFKNLPDDFRGRTIEGDALDKETLHRAGIETATGLAAVTSSDTTNLAVGHVAQTVFNVPQVVVRNYDTQYRPLFEAFNLQVVSSSSWGAQRIEELLYHKGMRVIFSAGNGEVEVYEFTVPQVWEGRTLGELLPPTGVAPVGLTRTGLAIIPDMDTRLAHGDTLLVSATMEGITAVRRQLTGVEV